MSVLDSVDSPSDLRELTLPQMHELAQEIRDFLIAKVSATGGHLGPNLGVVELTLALHRVFDSPNDASSSTPATSATCTRSSPAAKERFDTLRQRDGLTGYQERAESEHDWVESSHASAALSYADGLAKAFELAGESRHVVPVRRRRRADRRNVLGSAQQHRGRATGRWSSSSTTTAARTRRPSADSPAALVDCACSRATSAFSTRGGAAVLKMPLFGALAYSVLHGVKTGIKDAIAPQAMFTDLGIKYVGPVDGHDQAALEKALQRAKSFGGIGHRAHRHPKGRGLPPRRERRRRSDARDRHHRSGHRRNRRVCPRRTGRRCSPPR